MTQPQSAYDWDSVLLIDGMSVLVRCAKAAEKMPALSYNGVLTSTLTVFMNSLAKRLATAFGCCPTHAVICWDGVPQQNWRYEYFPGYRKSRSYLREPVSAELEQAKEFCYAAGLHQDWSPRFEGDDIVAAWWRLARQQRPGTPVVIVTSDADLLQLTDNHTTWWDAGDENGHLGRGAVRLAYGCEPEQLPLLRALAGDPSDEISGLRGAGISRAAGMVQQAGGKPEDIFRIVAELSCPEEGDRIRSFYVVSQLRDPVKRPEDDQQHAIFRCQPEAAFELARWRPGERTDAVRAFLEQYGMQRMLSRLDAGNLPWSDVS
jgi:DNA polymerase-1